MVFGLIIILINLVGCAENEFSQKPPLQITQEVYAGKVDILFVVDNSGSMYTEQVKMASSFPNLLGGMKANQLDYRIGIITTDVVSRSGKVNPEKELAGLAKGALQDGRLIKFPDGNSFLDSSSANIQSQFTRTIKRQETLDCERANYRPEYCPSDDERGIYAAKLAVKRNENKFFRSGSHIAFVFLSDEDVRGQALANPQDRPELQPEKNHDYPEALISAVYSDLGKSHTMSSHAVIVADSACESSQMRQDNNPYILAHIGYFYRSLTGPWRNSRLDPSRLLGSYAPSKVLNGTLGSICADNYTSQLGNMVSVMAQDTKRNISKQDLDCTPEKDTFKADYCPNGTTCRLSSEEDSVVFSPALRPDQTAKVSYLCYK